MCRIVTLAGLLVLAAAPAAAQDHAVAARVGLLGLGAEYTYDVNDRLSVRAGLNGASVGFDAEESGIDYEFDFDFDSLAVGVDFHPLASPLRLSIGVLRNDNELTALSRVSEPVTVGGTTYAPEDVGTLRGAVGFDDTAPYAGIGWDWSRNRRLFGISFDLGVVSQGTPAVSLSADGGIADDPMFEDDIRAEERELQESLDDFDLVPYASLGFVFRF